MEHTTQPENKRLLVSTSKTKSKQNIENGDQFTRKCLLEDLVTLESGSRPKGGIAKYAEGVPSIGAEHLNADGGFNYDRIKYVPQKFYEAMNKGKIKNNDVLLVKDGATIGKVSLVSRQFPFKHACINEHVFILRSKNLDTISQSYIFYYLRSPYSQDRIQTSISGTAQGGLTKKFTSQIFIPFPSLEGQRRIVKKIESIFAEIDSTMRYVIDGSNRISTIGHRIDNLKSSILNQIFDYECYKTYNKNSKYKMGQATKLSTLATINPKKPPAGSISAVTEVTYVPMRCIGTETGKIESCITKQYHEVSKGYNYFQDKDILFAKITPCMENGKIALASNLTNGIGFATTEVYVVRLKNNNMLPKFCLWYLMQPKLRRNARLTMSGSVGQLRMPLEFLQNVMVPVPPLAEQRIIVGKIESIFAKIDAEKQKFAKLHAQKQTYFEQLSKLRQSVLQQAFTGKLV